MRQWKCLFNLWNNLWKKAPFSIFGPKSWKHFFIFILFFRSFPFPDQRLESISLYLWNKVEKMKVFLYIYETRLKKWKYFFTFMKQGSESKIIYFIFMIQGSESESFSLLSWNKVRKVKMFLYFSWNKVQKVKVFLYFHETRLRNVMNRRRLATLSGEISAWSFIQHHLTSTLTWYTWRPKKNWLIRKKSLTKNECCGAKFSHKHDLGALDPA